MEAAAIAGKPRDRHRRCRRPRSRWRLRASRRLTTPPEYVATLKSLHSTAVQPQIDGQIIEILVKSGDRVRQGARLMQIDARRQRAAVSSQEAERASRQEAVAFARQQAQRTRELLAAGAISKEEQERAETALRTAEANLKALDAQVQEQEVQLRYYTVAAPTAGIVGDVPVRVGNQVDDADRADDDRSERDAGDPHLGADRTGAGAEESGCRFESSAATERQSWRRRKSASSRRMSTIKPSRCW